MPTFVGPLTDGVHMYDPDKQHTSGQHRLWSHYGHWAMVKTVWKCSDGTWREGIYPSQGGEIHDQFQKGLLTSHVTDTDPCSLANALVVYHGGQQYTITEAEAAELSAAGYGAYIT